MNKLGMKKITRTIAKNKPIRVMVLLIILFIAIILSLTTLSFSYKGRTGELHLEIQGIRTELQKLQNIATETEEENPDDEASNRGFAPYDEIVPFISLLENLFGLIDEKAIIIIKDEEKQILTNRYADYEVRTKVGTKKNFLFKALDELHQSKYLTRVMNFNMDYDISEDKEKNELAEVSLIIRLYFE